MIDTNLNIGNRLGHGQKILTVTAQVCFWLVLIALTGWAVLAIYYSNLPPVVREACSILFAFGAMAILVRVRPWRRAVTLFLTGFAVVLVWWLANPSSNDRDWQPDVAVLSSATIDGDQVTIHNIRNFDYRSETDFTEVYYDKTFDLGKLKSVDLIASYWMGPTIAHTFLSFGFDGGDHLAISIETRKEQGEEYSTIKGFFKQYELYYVVANERDVIRLRTNYRNNPPEDVYLYRIHGPLENGRQLFVEYIRRINSLRAEPEFYNTLTTNCTTTIWRNTRIIPGRVAFSWKLLLSGYVPEYLYGARRLDTSLPFPELQRRAHINARAREAGESEDFSQRIRIGLEAEGITQETFTSTSLSF